MAKCFWRSTLSLFCGPWHPTNNYSLDFDSSHCLLSEFHSHGKTKFIRAPELDRNLTGTMTSVLAEGKIYMYNTNMSHKYFCFLMILLLFYSWLLYWVKKLPLDTFGFCYTSFSSSLPSFSYLITLKIVGLFRTDMWSRYRLGYVSFISFKMFRFHTLFYLK